MSKLIEKLKELKNLVKLNDRYHWKIPTGCPIVIPSDLQTEYQKNVYLKQNLGRHIEESVYYWIIKKWGGIKSFKENNKNTLKIRIFLNHCKKNKSLTRKYFGTISSLSKVSSFDNPSHFFIYDSRVIYSINWLNLIYGERKKIWFPQPNGQNGEINSYNIDTIRLLSDSRVNIISYKTAYWDYCRFILETSNKLDYVNPWDLEMLLFVIADTEIISDIKLNTTIELPDITKQENIRITTVNSDEIEPLNEEPVLRELHVEHKVYQSFGSPNHLKRMAKISETASGITFSTGSNSGKKGGPLFCPELDIESISINEQDAVRLKNLLDILSGGRKANQLFKSSDYAAHASHGNSLKIDFTDYSNPSSSFSWEENVMIVKSGFLKQIANLMDGEVQ